MNLIELIKEINYQEAYSYEKRADLMNKYAIPTSQKFFNPIYELAKFICDRITHWKTDWTGWDGTHDHFQSGRFDNYSHSGAVATSFNKDFNVDPKINKDQKVIVNDKSDVIMIKAYDRNHKDEKYKYRPILRFYLDKRTFSLCEYMEKPSMSYIEIERNIYDKIDEWLVDFGYEKW